MDPLTCLGVACNVMQIISFAHEFGSTLKRYKKDGSTNPELHDQAGHIYAISNQLTKYLDTLDQTRLPKNQAELTSIAGQCVQMSKELQSKLTKIDSTRGGAFGKAIKTMWKKREIESLQGRIEKYQSDMDTHILVNLCNQSEAAYITNQAEFQKFDGVLQSFISAYAKGQNEVKKLLTDESWATRKYIDAAMMNIVKESRAENEKTRQHVTLAIETSKSKGSHKVQLDSILRSLCDPDMNTRKIQVEVPFSKTFSWIFDAGRHGPWDNFPKWLSSDEKIYWICGKAGSGKSTLMKFLTRNRETKHYLNQWGRNCAIYSHFIWSSGHPTQRSVSCLLRSLVHQILEKHFEIVVHILNILPETVPVYPNDWSRELLEEVLFRSLSLHNEPICLFLDGLDEIDAKDGSSDQKGPYYLLGLIEKLSNKGVKLCISSRPEPSYKFSLRNTPKLNLQDLTKSDIEAYTRDFVHTRCTFDFKEDSENTFIRAVIKRANGVFLWVSLALQNLQEGIISGDDPSELMNRLLALPQELKDLYAKMFERLGENRVQYEKDAAFYFNVAITVIDDVYTRSNSRNVYPTWNLFHYAMIFDSALRHIVLGYVQSLNPQPTLGDINKALLKLDQRLASRCAGLLEIVSRKDEEKDLKKILARDTKRPWRNLEIQFIHKSAKDFLLDSNSNLLKNDKMSRSDRFFLMHQALTAEDIFPSERYNDHILYTNPTMRSISHSVVSINAERRLDLLNLVRRVYGLNRWPEFLELTARYGLYDQAALLNDGKEVSHTLRNYLLLCSTSSILVAQGTKSTVSYLLNGEADPNYLGLAIMESGRERLYFPRPLMAYSLLYGPLRLRNKELVVDLLQLLLQSGADPNRKFIYCGRSGLNFFPWINVNRARPTVHGQKIESSGNNFLAESNVVDVIIDSFLSVDNVPDETWTTEILSKLGLSAERAHRKMLLYFSDSDVYGVGEEDSRAINTLLAWPKSSTQPAENTGLRNDKIQREIQEMLKGKEVYNVGRWLADRGYVLLQESDLEGITDETSVEEMAEIYQKLNEQFGPAMASTK